MRRQPDEILAALEGAGFTAYYVGGCVRDALLGRETHDWDVTTSARPEQVLALFSHCVPTGIQHGTVTVLLPDTQAEVTTLRRDGAYLDSRHPQQVLFVDDLREDLLRRDFTINAMARDLRGRLFDVSGGQTDLKTASSAAWATPRAAFRRTRCVFCARGAFRRSSAFASRTRRGGLRWQGRTRARGSRASACGTRRKKRSFRRARNCCGR